MSNTSFDGSTSQFTEYGESLRGYIRYRITEENLRPYISRLQNARILDIGGGSGIDAMWLANYGHNVDIVEPSEEQCSLAKSRFESASDDVRERVTITNGYIADLPKTLKESYDVVLSHGVAMYLDDPIQFIADAIGFLRNGGHLSLLEKGYIGTLDRLERKGQSDAVQELIKTKKMKNSMGRFVTAFTSKELIKIIRSLGCIPIEWYGVRVLYDDVDTAVESLSDQEKEKYIRDEYIAGRDAATKEHGNMLHFLAVKTF